MSSWRVIHEKDSHKDKHSKREMLGCIIDDLEELYEKMGDDDDFQERDDRMYEREDRMYERDGGMSERRRRRSNGRYY